MRTTLSTLAFVSLLAAPTVALADMPSSNCSGRAECSVCSPDGNTDGYCQDGECVEGSPSDCGSDGCNATGGSSAPTAVVVGGAFFALAVAWSQRKRAAKKR